MTKLTKELLLEKGTPKHSKLEHIKKINLSNLNLKTSDLDRVLFSQLSELEELDVSRNLLTEIPSNLGLYSLKCLNCASNDLNQVTSLSQFKNLEDLNCENNLRLTICDTYKLVYLLPNLQKFNGSNVSSNEYQLWFVNSRHLKRQVEMIASEILTSLLQHKGKSSDSENNENKDVLCTSGSSNASSGSCTELCSDRNTWLHSAKNIAKCAQHRKGKAPQNVNEDISKDKIQSRKERQTKPTNLSKKDNIFAINKEAKSECSATSIAASEESIPRKKTKCRTSVVLEPLHYLQCHSKNNNPEDFNTQLWACAFEPELESSQIPDVWMQSSRNVAVCGGDTVCIIDCETGIVHHKYKSIGDDFFSLAWTTLTMIDKDKERKLNVLAVAGQMGVVKLIHTKVNYCYGSIKAHRKSISTICFSPKRETFLFTASYDHTIILWDIGVPDLDYRFQASRLLVLKSGSTPFKMSLVPTCPDRYLVAACENGCFAWDITPTKPTGKRNFEMEFLFPIYNKEDENNYHVIDTLVFCSDDLIASKSSMQGSIYLWSWNKTLQKRKKQNTKVHAEILREFEWSNTDQLYIALAVCPAENYLLCGDEKGDVWMYKFDETSAEYLTYGKKTSPTQILKWPNIEVKGEIVEGTLINVAITDTEFKYLVAATDKNIIVIWKRI